MEVRNENAALLTNAEVFAYLKQQQVERHSADPGEHRRTKQAPNVATITYETLRYLERSPCVKQSAEVVKRFQQAVEEFSLTKAETLQLLNHRPTTAVEIQLIVEESEERLTEEQVDKLLEVIAQTLPDPSSDS